MICELYLYKAHVKKEALRDFPVVQWPRLHVPKAGGPGLIPGQGTIIFLLCLCRDVQMN